MPTKHSYNRAMIERRRWKQKIVKIMLFGFALVIILGTLIFQIPAVRELADWKIAELRTRIRYALSPPEEAVFTPNATVNETLAAYTPVVVNTATSTPEETLLLEPTFTLGPTFTPRPTSTPIPEQVLLGGIRHEYQTFNNCGPATLGMTLSYWGWQGDQRDTAAFLKPVAVDRNVMPYEIVNYVEQMTDMNALVRVGGTIEILEELIAAGIPVMIEKGLDDSKQGWMGHYQLLVGYDEARQQFNAYDSFTGDFSGGKTLIVPYAIIDEYWLHFNNTFIVIYPSNLEAVVTAILGSQIDETANILGAAEQASIDVLNLTGRDLFFAWFNRGSNLRLLSDYAGAAQAFDEAFNIYANLDKDDRPWRIIWYQTGPYFAYYFTGRYYDVLNLADQTLGIVDDLEESFYWRGLAKEALGDRDGAMADLRTSLEAHPGFEPSLFQLERIVSST